MTWQEEQQRERDATEEALLIGGLLAVLLGLRAGTRRIEWDAVRQRFTVEGRAVSIITIRKLLAKIEGDIGVRVSTFTDHLKAGRWTVDQWQRETIRVIGAAHILSGALAVGSIRAAVKDRDVQARIIA